MNKPIHIADYDGLIREVLEGGGEFRIYPHGTSMLPLLRQGVDSVVLRRMDTDPKPGDILFYQRADGSYVLHRVYAVTSQGLTLRGDNHCQLEPGIHREQIIGTVCRIYRGEKAVAPDSPGYQWYVRLCLRDSMHRVLVPIFHLQQKILKLCKQTEF